MKSPIDFVLWLNGVFAAIEADGDGPSKKQWETIKENLSEAVGSIVASKILEVADDINKQKQRNEIEAVMSLKALQAQFLKNQRVALGAPLTTSSPNMNMGIVYGSTTGAINNLP